MQAGLRRGEDNGALSKAECFATSLSSSPIFSPFSHFSHFLLSFFFLLSSHSFPHLRHRYSHSKLFFSFLSFFTFQHIQMINDSNNVVLAVVMNFSFFSWFPGSQSDNFRTMDMLLTIHIILESLTGWDIPL